MSLDRHSFLGAAAMLAAPRVLFAQAATARRFIFIIQHSAADGLNTVIPYAEPAYASLRAARSRCCRARAVDAVDSFVELPVAAGLD